MVFSNLIEKKTTISPQAWLETTQLITVNTITLISLQTHPKPIYNLNNIYLNYTTRIPLLCCQI
jgi:hypothetical protein